MRFNSVLAAVLAIAGSAPAATQSTAATQSPATIHSPLTVGPPIAPPVTAPVRIRTNFLKASELVGGKRVDLFIDGDRAAVLEWPAGERYGLPRDVSLESTSAVLTFLADRRYEFLWSPLTAWAGADLARFREHQRRKAEAISLRTRSTPALSPAESVASSRLSEFIRLTAIYLDIGEGALAQSVMENYLAAGRPRGGSDRRTLDWVLAKSRLATVMQARGMGEASLDHYDDIQRVAGRSVSAINGAVNHAAVLAELGHHARALEVIDTAWALFRQKAGDEGIAGSERQFAWIRACALTGLGRAEEATATYATLRESGRVTDRDFIVEAKESIEWRANWCMRREAALTKFLLDELRSDRPTYAVLALQPDYRGLIENAALLAKMRADPEIRAAAAARMRTLPALMVPAMNKYR